MANLIPVAHQVDCQPGQLLRVKMQDKRLLLANVDGTYYLVQEMCSHEEVSLYLGCLHGDTLKCSLHGSRFDLKTGAALDAPATIALQTYSVVVADGQVFISL